MPHSEASPLACGFAARLRNVCAISFLLPWVSFLYNAEEKMKKVKKGLAFFSALSYNSTVVADVAQQVERILGKDEVPGSNPAISSIKPVRNGWFSYVFSHFSASFGLSTCKTMTSSVFPSEIRQFLKSFYYYMRRQKSVSSYKIRGTFRWLLRRRSRRSCPCRNASKSSAA